METNTKSLNEKQRRFLLALPLLVLPFTALAFHALGGGKGTIEATEAQAPGINTNLPSADFSREKPQSKLDLYEQARQDSIKRARDRESRAAIANSISDGFTDTQEQRVMEKLALLEDELNKPLDGTPQTANAAPIPERQSATMPDTEADIERLERMMDNLYREDPAEDAELDQLNGMLERILDIQHPGRVHEKLMEQSLANKESAYPVNLAGDTLANNGIRAVIHRDQEAVNGSSIQLRLLDSIYVNGRLIPANSFVHGTCAVGGERLTITVRTLRHGNSILPVSLTAYDMDGMQGLYAPGALTRDAAAQGGNDAIQGMQLMSLDPSLAAQAATAGVNAAKGLFSRRIKQIKVKAKAGYTLLLRDDNQR
ncbi:hypothetical protein GCM10011386_38630 [Parapedobacter defluvii]|uniref:Conjugative transposon TraM C-terminal domain-containing protein n=1 Tax=Parapedobacter defluvii TaxID=2045106 RepID=A0ABQ1MLE0_9SPHI|nr:conjugative transposon protein TraM [Parapedobacter defluvii]GGC42660.1 hypothetical protein GCM10011386_38630 [Parapedobacter defluvii]